MLLFEGDKVSQLGLSFLSSFLCSDMWGRNYSGGQSKKKGIPCFLWVAPLSKSSCAKGESVHRDSLDVLLPWYLQFHMMSRFWISISKKLIATYNFTVPLPSLLSFTSSRWFEFELTGEIHQSPCVSCLESVSHYILCIARSQLPNQASP